MTSLHRHLPSRRICKPAAQPADRNQRLPLAEGWVMVEWCDRPSAMTAVPLADIEPLDGQGGAPDGQVAGKRPHIAAGRVWPSVGLEIEEWRN